MSKKVSLIFPGQGSQKQGMGLSFYESSSIAKEMIDNASDKLGFCFKQLLFESNDNLNKTEFSQPAILLVSSIANKLLSDNTNLDISFVLGHSLGEISANVASGSIDYLDAVSLVHKRGLLMSKACEGKDAGMLVILAMSDSDVEEICSNLNKQGKDIYMANYNVDGQIVLAGAKAHLEQAIPTFKEKGAKRAMLLPMNVASHCPFLNSCSDEFATLCDELLKDSFKYDIISNASKEKYNTKKQAVELLVKQLTSPVLYKQIIKQYSNEVDMFIELGFGNVLKGLNAKNTDKPTINVSDMNTLEATIEQLNA